MDAPILGEGHAGESFGAVAGAWGRWLHCPKSADCIIGTNVGARVKTGRAGMCRVQLLCKQQYHSLAGGLRCWVRTVAIPAKSNGLTNAGRTATEVKIA
jgi:hypothetical protein